MHGMGYCEAVEHIMGIEIPPQGAVSAHASGVRCRASTATCSGSACLPDAFGFESLFMQSWRIREKILDMFEYSTGGRVIFSVNKIGGQRKDMDGDPC